MEKIRLSNGTELDILNGATTGSVQMQYETFADIETLATQLTEENLSEYSILNDAGLVCTTQENKYVSLIQINPIAKMVTFVLSDVDMVAKRLAALESAQSALEQSQELQDGAIMELAELAAGEPSDAAEKGGGESDGKILRKQD